MKTCKGCGSPGPFPEKVPGKPRVWCVTCFNEKRRDQHGRSPVADPDLARLYKAAKKHPSFEGLCNALNISPKACTTLLAKAKRVGSPVHVEHNQVSIAPAAPIDLVQDVKISRKVGPDFAFGVLSDTHVGSKFCLRGILRETVQWMYDDGVRDIVHAGDVLEGCYRHATFEVSHSGFDAQMSDAAKVFPRLPGLRYHFISGNHDYTFEEHTGMRCGMAIENAMRSHGRNDWQCYGDRNAFLQLNGAVINLFHPRGGAAYAKSYNLQKKVESYTALKPHFLFVGHYHQTAYIYDRGVHAFLAPCTQGSGSNFAQSLKGGGPAIGGIMVKFGLTETGRIFDVRPTWRMFYEKEEIYQPRNALTMEERPAVGRDQRLRKGRERV